MSTHMNGNAETAEMTQKAQKSDDEISGQIIGAAIEVQRVLGTGLLESAYASALEIEFERLGLRVEREVPIRARYRGQDIGIVYRADFVIDGQVIVEIKAIETVTDAHRAQLLTYLRLAQLRLGLLLNFHDFSVAKGTRRVINNF